MGSKRERAGAPRHARSPSCRQIAAPLCHYSRNHCSWVSHLRWRKVEIDPQSVCAMQPLTTSKYINNRVRGEKWCGWQRTQQVPVLQRGSNALLIVELLIYSSFRGMGTRSNENINLEPRRERTKQLNSQAEANQRSHGAMWNRGREVNAHVALGVVHVTVFQFCDIELLQSKRVFRIINLTNQIYSGNASATD